jgi:hypothetical protein
VRSQHPALHPVPVASPARPNGVVVPHRCFGRRQSCLNTGTPMALGHSLCERDRTSTWSTRLFMTPGNRSFGVHLFTSEIPTEGVSWARWQPQPGVIAMPCLRHMNSDLSSVLATCCHRYTTVRLDLMDTLAVLDPSSLAGPFLECSLPCFEKPSTKRQTLQMRFRLQSAVQLDGRASLSSLCHITVFTTHWRLILYSCTGLGINLESSRSSAIDARA